MSEQPPQQPHPESRARDSYDMSIAGIGMHALAENVELKAQVARLSAENAELTAKSKLDPLTGLQNKIAWKEDLESRIEQGKPFGIAFLDLDAFKVINDKFGHGRGDEVLVQFSQFLRSWFQRKDDAIAHEGLIAEPGLAHDERTTSRFGGDEFAVTFDVSKNDRRNTDPHSRMDEEYQYIRSGLDVFVANQPIEIRATGFNVSIGIAFYDPSNPVDISTLLAQADEDMYDNKEYYKAAR